MRVCHKQTHSHLFYLAHTNNDGQQKICFGPYIIFKDRARARARALARTRCRKNRPLDHLYSLTCSILEL